MARRGLGEPVLMLSGRKSFASGRKTFVCPNPSDRSPSIYDKVVPRDRDGRPVYSPDVPYTNDIDLYPAGAPPRAPWMWGGSGLGGLGATFPEALPKDFPASLLPRSSFIPRWQLGQTGQLLTKAGAPVQEGPSTFLVKMTSSSEPVAEVYKPTYSYSVAQIHSAIVAHLGPQSGTEYIEHYWGQNTTNAVLRILPDTIEITVIDPRTGAHPRAYDKAMTVQIVIEAGSAEEFRRLFPSVASFLEANNAGSGVSLDIPSEISDDQARDLLERCPRSNFSTYGKQLACMGMQLAGDYGVSPTSTEGYALFESLKRALERVRIADAPPPQGTVSYEADTAAEEAGNGYEKTPDPIYQGKVAVTVPKGNLVFTETGEGAAEGGEVLDIEKAPESFLDYARKHTWVKPALVVAGLGVVAVGAAILRRRKK